MWNIVFSALLCISGGILILSLLARFNYEIMISFNFCRRLCFLVRSFHESARAPAASWDESCTLIFDGVIEQRLIWMFHMFTNAYWVLNSTTHMKSIIPVWNSEGRRNPTTTTTKATSNSTTRQYWLQQTQHIFFFNFKFFFLLWWRSSKESQNVNLHSSQTFRTWSIWLVVRRTLLC